MICCFDVVVQYCWLCVVLVYVAVVWQRLIWMNHIDLDLEFDEPLLCWSSRTQDVVNDGAQED